MQSRLQRSSKNTSVLKTLLKLIIAILLIFLAFFFIEKIDFPSPQKEIIEDVSDKIIKIK